MISLPGLLGLTVVEFLALISTMLHTQNQIAECLVSLHFILSCLDDSFGQARGLLALHSVVNKWHCAIGRGEWEECIRQSKAYKFNGE